MALKQLKIPKCSLQQSTFHETQALGTCQFIWYRNSQTQAPCTPVQQQLNRVRLLLNLFSFCARVSQRSWHIRRPVRLRVEKGISVTCLSTNKFDSHKSLTFGLHLTSLLPSAEKGTSVGECDLFPMREQVE